MSGIESEKANDSGSAGENERSTIGNVEMDEKSDAENDAGEIGATENQGDDDDNEEMQSINGEIKRTIQQKKREILDETYDTIFINIPFNTKMIGLICLNLIIFAYIPPL